MVLQKLWARMPVAENAEISIYSTGPVDRLAVDTLIEYLALIKHSFPKGAPSASTETPVP